MLQEPDPEIDQFVNSSIVSLRYAFVTQLLGKWDDPTRDLLSLQRGTAEGAEDEGRWDARSFCHRIVVPWVHENSFVWGPVPNHMRASLCVGRVWMCRQSICEIGKHGLHWLCIWKDWQEELDPKAIEKQVKRCLLSVARLLATMEIDYLVPMRINLENLCSLKSLTQKL